MDYVWHGSGRKHVIDADSWDYISIKFFHNSWLSTDLGAFHLLGILLMQCPGASSRCLVTRRAWRWLTVATLRLLRIARTLLTWIATTTARWWSAVLRLLSIWRLTWRRRSIALRWRTITLTWRSSVLASWWRAILTWRGSSGRATHVLLLVLCVVARIDCAEDELEHPKIRSEINRRLGTGHLGGFVLVVFYMSA